MSQIEQPIPQEVQWLSYLGLPPPRCPYKTSSLLLSVEETHQAGFSSIALCPNDLVITVGTAISRQDTGAIEKYLGRRDMRKPIYSAQCVQSLYNEQGVAEVFYYNVLVPVKNVLSLVLRNSGTFAQFEKDVYYKIEIRAQQLNTTDRGRCDHYVVLEPVNATESEEVAPPKSVVWLSVEEFRQEIAKRKIEMRNPGSASTNFRYPSIVLCVVEEKKPNVIDFDAWEPHYAFKNSIGARNVQKICPQLRKYSADSRCPLVLLTDYVSNLLISFQETGIRRHIGGPNNDDVILYADDNLSPRATVHRVQASPRYNLFMAAMERLIDARAIEITPE